jgi:hypothetical protein
MKCGVQHWKCEFCKGYNDILNVSCSFCKIHKPSWITALYQMRVEIERGIFDSSGVLSRFHWDWEGRVNKLKMSTPNEDLHAKFFNEEAMLVVSMTDIDLDEHIHELETIAREAKARILAASEEKRNRKAKAGSKAWRIEPNGPDPTVTDSINKVKQRSARMGKLEKMRDKMAALGLSDTDIDQMVSKMVAQARKDPEALKAENKLKGDLTTLPTIQSEEERQARKDEKKRLEDEDKAIAKAEKEKATPIVVENEPKLAIALEEAPAEAQKKSTIQPITGDSSSLDWLKKLT